MASWIAASTAYSSHGVPMIPFFILYSMFGFQRVGDLAWAAGDMRARGFILGGTAGRTTLAGEGLQHQDGHSHILAGTVPNCVSYDPTFSYELAVIVQDGLRRMYGEGESVYYYITVMNENYGHPDMPEGARDGILKGLYLFSEAGGRAKKKRVQLMGSGTILREVIAAAELLEADFGVAADIWSAPSFNELAREGQDCLRWNRLHPEEKPEISHVEQCLAGRSGPVIAATDYIKSYAEQIRALVPQPYLVLGTDGFGRSDTRKQLRKFFEVDRHFIAAAALKALADEGAVPASEVAKANKAYGIDAEKPNPRWS
jgi:pyruvate dehydrogenase E1 component